MICTHALERALTLPARWYVHPQLQAAERQAVFARHWQLVGHAAQLGAAGDHLPCEVAGLPLLLVRGNDDRLRALHNVCRHRAGPLATCAGRAARSLRCRYHGWTYTLEGQLRSAPEMQDALDFDPASIQLPQVRLQQWQGLLWVNLDPHAPALDTVLADVTTRLGERSFAADHFHSQMSYDIDCNWKTYVDNYLEGYHLPHVHPGLNRLLDYRRYRTELSRYSSLQCSPLDGGGPYSAGEALYWFIYPNTMLNVLPDRLQTNRVLPLGPQRCRVEFDFYYSGSLAGAALAEAAAADQRFSDEVQQEDISICVQVQRGLASSSYDRGRINPLRESALKHFHDLLREDLGDDTRLPQVSDPTHC